MNDRGVALIAVLWVVAVLGTIAAVSLGEVRTRLGAAAHRAETIRGRWTGEGCLALTRAALERALRAGREADWLAPSELAPSECDVQHDAPPDLPPDVNALGLGDLVALPGLDTALALAVLDHGRWGQRLERFSNLFQLATADQRDSLMAAYAELQTAVRYEPVGWDVTAGGFVTERWVRAGRRVAVVRRILW